MYPSGTIIPPLEVHPTTGMLPRASFAPSNTSSTLLSAEVYNRATFVCVKFSVAFCAASLPAVFESLAMLQPTFDFNIQSPPL